MASHFFTLGLLLDDLGGIYLPLVMFEGLLQLESALVETDGHLVFVAYNRGHLIIPCCLLDHPCSVWIVL